MITLLTGAGGFLGTRLTESLLRTGVRCLRLQFRQRVPAAQLARWRLEYPDCDIQSVGANLLSPASCRELVAGVTDVVHAAAGMKGAAPDMFANTVVASRNLLDALVAQGVRRITLVSSFAVYRTSHLARGAAMDEQVPLEDIGTLKGDYAYAKSRQEQLFRDYQARHGFELLVVRPGVIYGEGGGAFSPRVGIAAMGLFFSLGRGATLPLTYVANCADAIARVAVDGMPGQAYNVVDDDLPSCRHYLARYRREVKAMRVVPVPYWAFLLGARLLAGYHQRSRGQLPAVFSPYVVRSMFRPLRYSNAALKAIGWSPRVPTAEGLGRTFAWLKSGAG